MKYLKSSENPGGAVAVAITDSDLAAAAGAELISPDGNSSPCRDDGGSTTPEYNATEIPNGTEGAQSTTFCINSMSSFVLIHLPCACLEIN
jgi:hypothetical protein